MFLASEDRGRSKADAMEMATSDRSKVGDERRWTYAVTERMFELSWYGWAELLFDGTDG